MGKISWYTKAFCKGMIDIMYNNGGQFMVNCIILHGNFNSSDIQRSTKSAEGTELFSNKQT